MFHIVVFWDVHAKYWGLHVHFTYWLCFMYLQSGSHIFSVKNVKYIYSVLCFMVDSNDSIFGPCMCIHPSPNPIKYMAHMTYIPNLVAVITSSTYLSIICEVDIMVGYIFGMHMQKCWGFILMLYIG